ncbi:hypothetical protein TrRE_jg12730, partial [Triparma retinervis]
WIQEICYTFEGSSMVVGSHDNCIYVYDVQNAYSFAGKMDSFSSFLTHIDFGILLGDGETMNERGVVVDVKGGKRSRNVEVDEIWMQVCTGDDTISFWNVKTMEEEKSANKLKDLVFATYSQTLGFPVQGIKGKGKGKGKSKVLSVDRNHIYRKVPVLATSDELGVIRLYNYPCYVGRPDETFQFAYGVALTIFPDFMGARDGDSQSASIAGPAGAYGAWAPGRVEICSCGTRAIIYRDAICDTVLGIDQCKSKSVMYLAKLPESSVIEGKTYDELAALVYPTLPLTLEDQSESERRTSEGFC